MKKTLLIISLLLSLASTVKAQNSKFKDNPAWLHNAIFYQIYPSSYMDSDGNGIGDLPGITSKLDYIKSIGINAIWLNPIFESGWFDGGYDIIDFYKVDPRFGTNTDLVTLVNEAHKRGIKVCLDLVAGHTSVKCAWFKESMDKDTNLHFSDYYIWSNEISDNDKKDIELRKQDPNPATSGRGKWVEANAPRAKYYLKNYYECQAALNYGYAHPNSNHPWEEDVNAPGPQAVRRELRNIMAFWMDKGVDGFRVDMAASLVKNDDNKVETTKLWNEMRIWKDKNYPDCVLISEWSHPSLAIPAGFNIDFMIHFNIKGYPSLFFDKATPFGDRVNSEYSYFNKTGKGQLNEFIENYTREYNATKKLGYIALPTANHDFQRANIGTRNTIDQLKVAMTFFLTMPGVPFIYYGDEIAMKYQMNLPDKEGSKRRSGTRTPMQWTDGITAGFSTCSPNKLYFPIDTENGKLTVSTQDKEKSSMLNFVRNLIKLRQSSKALGNDGDWQMLSCVDNPYPWIYKRSMGNESYIVVLNPSEKKVSAMISTQGKKATANMISGKVKYKSGTANDKITINGFSSAIFKLDE